MGSLDYSRVWQQDSDDTEASLNFRPDLRSLFEKVLGIYLKKKITADL